MKEFNLDKVLAGAKVVTRDGQDIGQIHFFSDSLTAYPVHATVNQGVLTYTKEGIYDNGKYGHGNGLDLFLKVESKIGWINLIKGDGVLSPPDVRPYNIIYETEEAAIADSRKFANFIATIKIEWEE